MPVVGYGTDEFPAFYVPSSGEPIDARVDTPRQAAELLRAHWDLGGAGVVLAQPVDAHVALEPDDFMAPCPPPSSRPWATACAARS